MGTRHINRIWLYMVAATLITFGIGESGLTRVSSTWTIGLMFTLAYTKGVLVILDFMELRHAPAMWRALLLGWASVTVFAILLGWWMGSRG